MSNTVVAEHAAPFRQILGGNFNVYLIICSPGVKHVRELKEAISNTHSNMRHVILYIKVKVSGDRPRWP